MRFNQTPMPPTPQDIMRKANTSRIARSLTDPVGGTIQPMPPIMPGTGTGPALLGPPIHQPPQTDPVTPGPSQIGGTLTPGGVAGPFDNSPTGNPALLSYEALMRSAGPGLRAAQPMLPPKPMAGGGIDPISDPIGGHTDPYLGDFGAPMAGGSAEDPVVQLPTDPGIGGGPGLIPPPMSTGPHPDPYGLDPAGEAGPGIEPDILPGTGGPSYGAWPYHPVNPSGISGGGRPPGQGYIPRLTETGGANPGTFNQGPHIPGNGGVVGVGHNSTPQEPWYGRVARSVIPYGAGQIAHMIAEYARRHGSGTVGGAAHVVGRNPATGQPGATTGPTPTNRQPGTHFDFTRGQYVHNNNATGAQFSPQAANALLMWSQNIHQPTNLRQSDVVSRFLNGPARTMTPSGEFEETGTGRSGYSGTTGNPTLTTDPRAIAAYNAYVMNRGR